MIHPLDDESIERAAVHNADRVSDHDERMRWLQSMITLHTTIEFLYVVDGYMAEYVIHDGATTANIGAGETIIEAIDDLRRQFP